MIRILLSTGFYIDFAPKQASRGLFPDKTKIQKKRDLIALKI